MNFLKNILDIAKYKKLRKLEYKRWISILIYMGLYFAIEAYANANNIAFALWDTLMTSTILLLVFIFGNFFCGYACFMQRFQDALGIVGRVVFRKKYNNFIPQKSRKKLKWLKYIFAGITLLIPLAMRDYNIFLKFWGWAFTAGMLLSLVERRAYCKYFCFVGALVKISSLKNQKLLVRDLNKCVDCKLCSTVCPQDCDPATKDTPLNKDLWCTSCDRCKTVCPTKAIVVERKQVS